MRILTYWIIFGGLVHPFASKENIALNKDTRQSSNRSSFTGSSLANDGFSENDFHSCRSAWYFSFCSETLENQTEYWWAVDLGQVFNINTITIYLYKEEDCYFRLTDFEIFIYNPSLSNWTSFDQEQEQLCFLHEGAAPSVLSIACNRICRGRYIKIYKKRHYSPYKDTLSLCEVEVFADQNPKEGFYCKQLYKQPMMRVQTNLTNFTVARCAMSCRNIDSCLGFTITSDGTCSLFQTSKYLPSDSSTDRGSSDNEYFEKC